MRARVLRSLCVLLLVKHSVESTEQVGFQGADANGQDTGGRLRHSSELFMPAPPWRSTWVSFSRVAYLVAIGIMQLATSGFTNWWWD